MAKKNTLSPGEKLVGVTTLVAGSYFIYDHVKDGHKPSHNVAAVAALAVGGYLAYQHFKK